jgi:HK97 family phage prohead protease
MIESTTAAESPAHVQADNTDQPAMVEPETREVAEPGVTRAMDTTDVPDDDEEVRDTADGDGDDDEPDDERGMKICRSGLSHARAMCRAGKVSHGPFSFDAEDRAGLLGPNGTHTSEYARHHLGSDDSEDDAVKRCAYPFAKGGMAYSRAFRSIARRAAAAGHDVVAKAANDLMELAKPPEDDGKDEPAPPKSKGKGRAGRSGRTHYRDLAFRATKTEPDGSYFEGYCAVHYGIDEYGTIMGGPAAFREDLPLFEREGFLGGLNHDWDNPIGSPGVVRLDDHGLFVGGNVLDTAHGLDVRKLLAAGVVKKLSFGFDVLQQRWLEEPEDIEEYWRTVGYQPSDEDRDRARRGALLFERIRVFEASPVMVPGKGNADITAVRSDDGSADDPGSLHLTLESHALAVRDAVNAYCDRLVQLAGLRAAQGRSLAPDRTAGLREIRDRAAAALDACRPRASKADVAALWRELFDLDLDVS